MNDFMRNALAMTGLQRKHVWMLLGGLFLVVIGYIAYDVYIISKEPEGSSISWSFTLMMYKYPLFTFWLGALVIGVPTNLVTHFVGGMESPEEDELQKEKDQKIADLEKEVKMLSAALNTK